SGSSTRPRAAAVTGTSTSSSSRPTATPTSTRCTSTSSFRRARSPTPVTRVVRPISDPFVRGREFFDVTVLLLALCAVAGTLATAYLAGRSRRWTALGVALAPGLILASFINWDLIAMALVALGMAAWAARQTVLAGVLLGLAVATNFYPLLFFGPLLLLCLRAGRMRAFWTTTASAAVAWLAVNLPVAFAAPAGWGRFYALSRDRPADWGSVWYFFETEHWPFVGSLTRGSLHP